MATYNITATGQNIEAEAAFMAAQYPNGGYTLVALDNAAVTAVPCPAYEFYRFLTSAERIAIHALAATDMAVYDFMYTLQVTISNGGNVLATDPDMVTALAYLQTVPSGAPIFSAARAAAIIAFIQNYT
ncbi:MAG: hypothetical protein P4L91_07995 [Burkholderiaceae bacterium]|nr:hypothetical protein [Burkholderiaceae bacterium]